MQNVAIDRSNYGRIPPGSPLARMNTIAHVQTPLSDDVLAEQYVVRSAAQQAAASRYVDPSTLPRVGVVPNTGLTN